MAADTSRLVEPGSLQTNRRCVAVVVGLVVVARREVGVHQAATFDKSLHVLHADLAVRLLEDEGAVVGVVVGHRAGAALQRLLGQRCIHQARLHAVPGPQARADEANVPAQIKIMLDAAGGTYDLYARLVSRHWGNKLPGNPKIVVEYMPGNSGTRVLNYLYTVAPRDGSVVDTVNSAMARSMQFSSSRSSRTWFRMSTLGQTATRATTFQLIAPLHQ